MTNETNERKDSKGPQGQRSPLQFSTVKPYHRDVCPSGFLVFCKIQHTAFSSSVDAFSKTRTIVGIRLSAKSNTITPTNFGDFADESIKEVKPFLMRSKFRLHLTDLSVTDSRRKKNIL